MAYGQYPEYTALQRSMADLDNMRHGIDQISEKAFSRNLINESNKCLNPGIGEQERTKYLKIALLDRTKSSPETFSTLVEVLKDTHGLDFIGELLEKNLEAVKLEQTAPTRDAMVGCGNVTSDSKLQMRHLSGFDEGIPAFRKEYSPIQGSPVSVEVQPSRRRSRDTMPTSMEQKPYKLRSRSLTPPPISYRSHKISLPLHLDSQAPDTPPFLPMNFKIRNETLAKTSPPVTPIPVTTPQSSSVSEYDKNNNEQVRFSTPTHSDPEKELVVCVPMPVSSSEREETTSNPSPSLVTGQSGTNYRASLEVPASPNLLVLRSCSTESTDTDSDMYVTPRQSMSEVEVEKIHRERARTKKNAMCENCRVLKRNLSDSKEAISKLKTQNELMFKERLQKDVECSNLKEACDSALVFLQELEAKVAKFKQLVYSKEMEAEEAWRHYDAAFDFMRKCSLIQAHHRTMQGQMDKGNGLLDDDEDKLFRAEQSYSSGDECDSDSGRGYSNSSLLDHSTGSRWKSQGKGARSLEESVRGQGSAKHHIIDNYKQTTTKRESHSRSNQLIMMMEKAKAPPVPLRRNASDSHPKKKHGVQPSQCSLQQDTITNMRSRYCTYPPQQFQGEGLQLDTHCLSSEAHRLFSATKSHKPRHGTNPKSQMWKHRIPLAETGYWEEQGERNCH